MHFTDLKNLDEYVDSMEIGVGVFVLITDHVHYMTKPRTVLTNDFDLSNGAIYLKGNILTYRTTKEYGGPISLERDYHIQWKEAGGYFDFLHWVERGLQSTLKAIMLVFQFYGTKFLFFA